MGEPVKNEPGSTSVASRDAFGDALVRLGETHPELVVLEADLSESTRSKKFAKKFPERFFQMGIAEANMSTRPSSFTSSARLMSIQRFIVSQATNFGFFACSSTPSCSTGSMLARNT